MNVSTQTWHSCFKYNLVRKGTLSLRSRCRTRLTTSARTRQMASVVDQLKAENRQLRNENGVQKANIEVLLHNAEVAEAKIDQLTAGIVRTKNELVIGRYGI